MVGKLIIHRPTREQALACTRRALDEFLVEGIKTTIPLARRLLDLDAFIDGEIDTTYLEREILGHQH